MATTKLKGKIIHLKGKELNIGDKVPQLTVVNQDLTDIEIGKKAQILVTVPSLDTPICAEETRKFNENAAKTDIEVVVISMDLPFAAGRFCTTEGIENLKVGSDFRNKDFSNAFGVLIEDGPLAGVACRAVFVTNNEGIIIHKEICEDITNEPNYDEIYTTIKNKL